MLKKKKIRSEIWRSISFKIKSSHASKELGKWWITLPDSPTRFKWDTMIMILVFALAVLDPLKIAFEKIESGPMLEYNGLEILAQVLFSIDMILNFTTALKEHGEYNRDQYEIAKDYASSWFPIDLLSIIPFSSLKFENPTPAHRVLAAFKLLRVFRITRILKRFEESMKLAPTTLTLIKLGLALFLIWHWVACGFWFVQRFEEKPTLEAIENIWIPPPETSSSISLGEQYRASLFWGLMTVTGSGRDIRPATKYELIFTIVAIIIGVFIYAFVIGGFTSTLSEYDLEESEKRRKQTAIREFLVKRNVQLGLRKQVITWFERLQGNNNLLDGHSNKILRHLHYPVALEVKYLSSSALFEDVRLFRYVSSFECRIALVSKFKRVLVIPNETVIVEGEIGETMYVVASGLLSAWISKGQEDEKCVSTFRRGDTFGEVSLLRDTKRNASIIANDYSELLVLERNDFDEVKERYPNFSRTLARIAMLKSFGWGKLRNLLDQATMIRLITGTPLSMPVLLNLKNGKQHRTKGKDVSEEERNKIMLVACEAQQQKSAKVVLEGILKRRREKVRGIKR